MTTDAIRRLNRSKRTFEDVRRFANEAPADARRYLKEVEADLRAQGKPAAARAVAAVLTARGDLVERLSKNEAALGNVFPKTADDWGKVQLERQQTVGYGYTAPQQPNYYGYNTYDEPTVKKAQFLTGTLRIDDGVHKIATAGGQSLVLAESDGMRNIDNGALDASLLAGFKGDGPISFQGTISEDGKTFNVEGYALNTDGKFDTMTFGRVKTAGARVYIETARGEVTVEHPELKKKLKALPQLGIILPNEPEGTGKRLVYKGNPSEFFALARFNDKATRKDGAMFATADMAYSNFSAKPVRVPDNAVKRTEHGARIWLRGTVNLTNRGEASSFTASYVSKSTDNNSVSPESYAQTADAVQSAVMRDFV